MKTLLFLVIAFFAFSQKNRLEHSVWVCPVSKNHADKLKFGPGNRVTEYDCEMNYTFHDTYRISKDTIIINGKDESHSEDGGKVLYYRVFI